MTEDPESGSSDFAFDGAGTVGVGSVTFGVVVFSASGSVGFGALVVCAVSVDMATLNRSPSISIESHPDFSIALKRDHPLLTVPFFDVHTVGHPFFGSHRRHLVSYPTLFKPKL